MNDPLDRWLEDMAGRSHGGLESLEAAISARVADEPRSPVRAQLVATALFAAVLGFGGSALPGKAGANQPATPVDMTGGLAPSTLLGGHR